MGQEVVTDTKDPNWGLAAGGSPSEPHIGPRPSDAPVTLGDLVDNPSDAMQRIGASLKRDITDPKLWLAAAASYFGPKAMNIVAPVVLKAAVGAGRMASAIQPGDIGIISPRIGRAVEMAQRVGSAAVTPDAPPAPTPLAPSVSAGQVVRAATSAGERFSAAEVAQGIKWHQEGVPTSDIVQRIISARAFNQKLGLPK